MKRLNLMIFFLAAFLTACPSSWHKVNLDGLSSAQDQVFHVRSVEIDCVKITKILGRCSTDCQLAILNNIPTSDITRILSESYAIKIAQENNLSVVRHQIKDPKEHIFPATEIRMGKVKVAFHIEDFFRDYKIDSSNTCFSLHDKTYYTHYIDIRYTLDFLGLQPPFDRGVTLWYDIEAVTAIQEQSSITAAPSWSEVVLIGHMDEIETFRFDSNDNKLDKMRDAAVKIPSALEHDIKAYSSANKPGVVKIDMTPDAQGTLPPAGPLTL